MVPVSVVAVPSPLHTVLRGYKDAAVAEARRRFSSLVELLLAGFVARHGCCVERVVGGVVDMVVPVPPTRRPGRPPLAGLGPAQWSGRVRPVLARGPGPLRHLAASRHGYVMAGRQAAAEVAGRRVVLLDDTLTTGARAQSAAVALSEAGAGPVTVLVVGRVVRPGRSAVQAAYWDRVGAAGFSPDSCCVPGCPGTDTVPGLTVPGTEKS